MTPAEIIAQKWLREKREEMLNCPHQPGNLLISKKACSERHRISRKIKGNGFWHDNGGYYSYRTGLMKCRECLIGKKLAKLKTLN